MNNEERIDIRDMDPTRELSDEEMEAISGGKGVVSAVVAAASAATVFASFNSIEKSLLDISGQGGQGHGISSVQALEKMTSQIYGTDDEDGDAQAAAAASAAPVAAQGNTQAQAQPQMSLGSPADGSLSPEFTAKHGVNAIPQDGTGDNNKAAGAEGAVSPS